MISFPIRYWTRWSIGTIPGSPSFRQMDWKCRRAAIDFFRGSPQQGRPAASDPLRLGFVTHMMDHGYVFNGPHWKFTDSPLQGLYLRHSVYENVRSLDDFSHGSIEWCTFQKRSWSRHDDKSLRNGWQGMKKRSKRYLRD